MGKTVKVFLFFSLLIFHFSLVIAQTEADFETDGGTIFRYNGRATELVIPAKIGGVTITAVGQGAFMNKGITSVTIPDCITSISEWAFARNQLTSVTIPPGVISIHGRAFSDNQLTSVIIPDGVTFIGWSAFSQNQLTAITIPDSVTSIDEGAFVDNQLVSITIGGNVTFAGGKYPPFDNGFFDFYNRKGKRAGTYVFSGEGWRSDG